MIMLLLFVVASLCHLSAGVLCSCPDSFESEEHICCSCEDHIQDCSHHDMSFSGLGCKVHFSFQSDAIHFIESKSQSQEQTHYNLFLCCIILNLVEQASLDDSFNVFDNYRFSSTEWSVLSCSLRAPPVLV